MAAWLIGLLGTYGFVLTVVFAGLVYDGKVRHRHALVAQTVQHAGGVATAVTGFSSTAVLWKCKRCSAVEVTTLPGRWTLKEVRGEVAPTLTVNIAPGVRSTGEMVKSS